MKIIFCVLLTSAWQVFSQGQLAWNSGPIYYGDTSTLASPANGPFWAMLFGGPAGSPVNSLTSGAVSGGPVSVGDPTPGYVNGGTRSVTGVPAGSQVTLQVRAWHASLGSAWELIPGVQLDGSTPGTGLSSTITLTLGGGSTPIPNLANLGLFIISPIPEPSIVCVVILGLAACGFARRGNNLRRLAGLS